MILLETNDLYYNTQVYFRKNHWINMPNHERVWAERYHKWLAEQGCAIVLTKSDIEVVRNSLGISPGYDKFGFENERDATMFVLRWS